MGDSKPIDAILEEQRICAVRRDWAFARDLGEWDLLRSCFHPDATITVAWYSGSATGFIERSIGMSKHRRPEERHKHWIGNMRARAVGARGILEADTMILIREYIGDDLYDYCGYARFFDRVEKRDGVWRIQTATCFYDKDTLAPVLPTTRMPNSLSGLAPTGIESGLFYMVLRQQWKGRPVPPHLICGGSPQEADFRREAMAWLAAGA